MSVLVFKFSLNVSRRVLHIQRSDFSKCEMQVSNLSMQLAIFLLNTYKLRFSQIYRSDFAEIQIVCAPDDNECQIEAF